MGLSYVGIWVARGVGIQRAQYAGTVGLERGRLLRIRHHPAVHHDGHRAGKPTSARTHSRCSGLLGRLRGGLGMATVFANAIFASIVGSSVASAAVSRKSLCRRGRGRLHQEVLRWLRRGFIGLGMLIPPSLLLIIYGLVAEELVGKLFIAAVIPGIILALVFCIGIWRSPSSSPTMSAAA